MSDHAVKFLYNQIINSITLASTIKLILFTLITTPLDNRDQWAHDQTKDSDEIKTNELH